MKLVGYALEMLRSELEDVVGHENVISSEEKRKELSIDQYWLTHMWKEEEQEIPLPDFIVMPTSTEETSKVMSICNNFKVPVTVRGGGSGTQGGASTMFGGILLDITKMDKIIDVDEESLILTAQPGI